MGPFSFKRSRSRLSQRLRAASVRTHLVQCCLGNRVVLDTEPLFIGHHQLKYPGQGGGGDLVLQRVVVLLPLNGAGEGALHEALHGLQVRGRARLSCLDFHGHYVPIAEPGSRKRSVETWITINITYRNTEATIQFNVNGSKLFCTLTLSPNAILLLHPDKQNLLVLE